MADHTLCSSKEFGRRFAAREASWINILKTLTPRGYNANNDRPTHRQANMLNNAKPRESRAAAALATTMITESSEAASTPPVAPAPAASPTAHPIPPSTSDVHDTTVLMAGITTLYFPWTLSPAACCWWPASLSADSLPARAQPDTNCNQILSAESLTLAACTLRRGLTSFCSHTIPWDRASSLF